MSLDTIFKFYGGQNHSPMWWTIELFDPTEEQNVRWGVLESYDEGKTWITNCIFETYEGAWDFIAGWFAQFYEG